MVARATLPETCRDVNDLRHGLSLVDSECILRDTTHRRKYPPADSSNENLFVVYNWFVNSHTNLVSSRSFNNRGEKNQYIPNCKRLLIIINLYILMC